MPVPIIQVQGLSKEYTIGAQSKRYDTFRDMIVRSLQAPLRFFSKTKNSLSNQTKIWALNDVSFEVKQGEIIGIIGRNGSGKSTLLKILSRITEPTKGKIEIRGRVASLLEVGTGFHPELTGKENIYLNGAILGMSKTEINKKYDEIVSFAEVEKFIDTPVKHYSSGMYVRLAFAVAAHLEPEILLVDEVLAVGDASFQRKCIGKMSDASKQGRTILFVSHNMAAVNRLCNRVVWLEKAKVAANGDAETIVSSYLSNNGEDQAKAERYWNDNSSAPGTQKLILRAVRILDVEGQLCSVVDIRKSFYVQIQYEVLEQISDVRIVFRLVASEGSVVFTSADSSDPNWPGDPKAPGLYAAYCEIPGNFMNEGIYSVNVSGEIPFVKWLFLEENVIQFHVAQTGGVSGRFPERWPGVICPILKWRTEFLG